MHDHGVFEMKTSTDWNTPLGSTHRCHERRIEVKLLFDTYHLRGSRLQRRTETGTLTSFKMGRKTRVPSNKHQER